MVLLSCQCLQVRADALERREAQLALREAAVEEKETCATQLMQDARRVRKKAGEVVARLQQEADELKAALQAAGRHHIEASPLSLLF